jgi:hypothetical protein
LCRRRKGGLIRLSVADLRQKADFGTTFGEHEHIAIFEISFRYPLAIDIGAIGALIDELETVAFANNAGVNARECHHLFRELDLAVRMAAHSNFAFRQLLYLTLKRALHVYELNRDKRNTAHGRNSIVDFEVAGFIILLAALLNALQFFQ